MSVESLSDWRTAHPAPEEIAATFLTLELMTTHALLVCAIARGWLRLLREREAQL